MAALPLVLLFLLFLLHVEEEEVGKAAQRFGSKRRVSSSFFGRAARAPPKLCACDGV